MLHYGRLRLLFDSVPEGVMVTVFDENGFVCRGVGRDGRIAARVALQAADASLYDR